jgi:uncharacterized membrane protein YdjX (TVP38/TMEM64 family)
VEVLDVRLHWRVVVAAFAWLSLIGGWIAYQRSSGLGALDVAQRFVDASEDNWWAIVAFAAVATVRPVVLFPATVLTIAAGVLFGPVIGTVVAAASANGSALLAHMIGAHLRARDRTEADAAAPLAAWTRRLQANGFEAVLLMRLVFLPYDPVSYACGLLRVRRREFLAANAIGTLPGTIAFVLVGASVERLDEGLGGIDRTVLAVSVVLVLCSIAASRVVRRHIPDVEAARRGDCTNEIV